MSTHGRDGGHTKKDHPQLFTPLRDSIGAAASGLPATEADGCGPSVSISVPSEAEIQLIKVTSRYTINILNGPSEEDKDERQAFRRRRDT